jgi:hypothetical protein
MSTLHVEGHIMFFNMLVRSTVLKHTSSDLQINHVLRKVRYNLKFEAHVIIDLCAQEKAKISQIIIAPCDIAKHCSLRITDLAAENQLKVR